MPSLLKTAFLQLNKWAGNEYPKREDFVSDNEKIDVFASNISSQMAQIGLNVTDLIDNKSINSRGSNANGEWIRFSDGTQICTIRRDVASQNIPVGSKRVEIWTFPSAFVGSPSVAGEINLFSNAGNILSTSLNYVGNSTASDAIRVVAINAGADEFGSTGLTAVSSVFTGITIGRWK